MRDRNQLLLAAGYAPQYAARSLDDPELAPIRDALGHVLAGHQPYPAMAVDHRWNLVASTARSGRCWKAQRPSSCDRRSILHHDWRCTRTGWHREISNLDEWRAHLLGRLEREIRLTGDEGVRELYEELLGYPGPDTAKLEPAANEIMVGLRLATRRR